MRTITFVIMCVLLLCVSAKGATVAEVSNQEYSYYPSFDESKTWNGFPFIEKHDWKEIRDNYKEYWLEYKKENHEKATAVPLPNALALLSVGVISLVIIRRKN